MLLLCSKTNSQLPMWQVAFQRHSTETLLAEFMTSEFKTDKHGIRNLSHRKCQQKQYSVHAYLSLVSVHLCAACVYLARMLVYLLVRPCLNPKPHTKTPLIWRLYPVQLVYKINSLSASHGN